MGYAQEILDEVLPTKLSKWFVTLTVILVPIFYNLPLLLPPIWLPSSQEQIFLIRVTLSLLMMLLGMFAILVNIVIHVKKLVKTQSLHEKEIELLKETYEARIAEIKELTDPVNNLKLGEALIIENLWSVNPIYKKVNMPS